MNNKIASGDFVSTLPIPRISFHRKIRRFHYLLKNTFKLQRKSESHANSDLASEASQDDSGVPSKNQFGKFKIDSGKLIKYALLVIAAVVLVFAGRKLLKSDTIGNQSESQVEVMGAKKTLELNKELNFPLKNADGEEISNIKFVIEKAEFRDEIVVQGKKATSVKGRTFLILTLKITNEYNQSIEIDTKDYIRLSVNGNTDEWLAPDIHNDPVEVQAISTKYTRVGFPINNSDKDLVLKLGEIEGEKEELKLEII